jgi:class 3 adenylate cyclase/tetratricopeptide (TPR) repeat protein
VSTIAEWLAALGMSEYAGRFAENRIDLSVLQDLTDQDLKDLGVVLGDRRKMLRAIGELRGAGPATSQSPTVTEARPQDSAERRQLTVMFCDLVESTALSGRLDPEELRSIIAAYHRCCTELVERIGGFVAKYMGDGVLAYFGYPKAHEHDAERAVRAGLALVEVVPTLETAIKVPLQVRVGIATGLVVVGDLTGAGGTQEQAVVGETPNLAARLQALAEPGTVVIASRTRRLTGGLFEYRDLGNFSLKGFKDNVPAWLVLGEGTVESRFEAMHAAGLTALVGRDEEIDLLLRRWEQAKQGEGCVVLISGEPGIGKSRIAATVAGRVNGEPHTRLRYFCSPHHQDSAFYPSTAWLERAAGFRREDTADQRLDKLEAVLARGTRDLNEAVPLMADLLLIPTGDRYPPLNLTPQKRKDQTLRSQLAQVEGLAARQPVLMVFEDVHWSDPTTRELLDLLIDRVPTLRVLVIITFRPEFAPAWVGRPQVSLLSLNRLRPRQCAEMIAHVTGGQALPKEIADQIVDRTDGVPLFIEELTKAVVESGALADAGDCDPATGPVARPVIPTTLHASLLARLDRFAPTHEVAQIAAALGRQFSHELISAVATIPQVQLDDGLAQLERAELIFRRGIAPDAEYTFKHALVQDAAYGTLLHSRRQQLHRRIAATLERRFPEIVETQPRVLARHCAEAGLVEKAVDYCLKAGRQAMARASMMEAEMQLRKGLDLLVSLPENTKRREREIDLQIALTRTLITTQGYASRAMAEPQARARQLYDRLGQPRHFDMVLTSQFDYHLIRAELPLACEIARECLVRDEVQYDPLAKFRSFRMNLAAWFCRGEFTAVCGYVEQALSLYNFQYPTFALETYARTTVFSYWSLALFHLGYLDQARVHREQVLAGAREHAFSFALALSLGSHIHLQPTLMLQRCRQLETHCAEHGFPYLSSYAIARRGSALLALGRTEEGLALLVKGLAAYRATGAALFVPTLLTELAEGYGNGGRLSEGLRCLDEVAGLIEVTQERWAEGDMHRARGELLVAIGDFAGAETSFHQAIAVARRQSAKLWELRAATGLARLWRDQGKRTEARDLLVPIYGWFTEGFDTPVLQGAKALLNELP